MEQEKRKVKRAKKRLTQFHLLSRGNAGTSSEFNEECLSTHKKREEREEEEGGEEEKNLFFKKRRGNYVYSNTDLRLTSGASNARAGARGITGLVEG
jgi:hypothetical protein